MQEINFLNNKVKFELETEADFSVFEEVFKDREYKVVDDLIKKAKTILDIGAHIGCFSVYAGMLNTTVHVLAFEPDTRNFTLLKKNLELNGVRNVKAKNVAVSADGKVRDFYLNVDSHNHSFFGEGNVVKVNCKKFADILAPLGHCDFVKMDCEGAEFEILLGLEDFSSIGAIFLEYHLFGGKNDLNTLKNKLNAQGFKLKDFPSRYDKDLGMILAFR